MRAIKVTFRAVFQQPIRELNPMGLKIGGDLAVEIYGSAEKWFARYLGSRATLPLGKFVSLDHGKMEVKYNFERQTIDWQIWGTPPEVDPRRPISETASRMLTPYEVADLGDGKFGWIQDEDRTHIIHAPTIPPGARIPPAACGALVNAKCFISTKANVEPTCRGCAEVWRKEYRGK